MAGLTRPDVRLTAKEQASLRRRMDRRLRADFGAWRRLTRERSDPGLRHAKAVDAELVRCGIDLDRVYRPIDESQRREFERRAAQTRRRRPRRPAKSRPNQTVYGAWSGSDFPPFDYSDDSFFFGGDQYTFLDADRQNGILEIASQSRFGPRIYAGATATIGFWSVPSPQAAGRIFNVYTGFGTTQSVENVHAISVHYSTCSGFGAVDLSVWPYDTAANAFDYPRAVSTTATLFDFTIWASNGFVRQITEPVNLSASLPIAPQRAYLTLLSLRTFLSTQNLAGVNLDVKITVGGFYFQTI